MGIKFITINENNEVMGKHMQYQAYTDEEKEMIGVGYIVENIPDDRYEKGKCIRLCYDPMKKEFYYVTEECKLDQEVYIAELENQLLLIEEERVGGIL